MGDPVFQAQGIRLLQKLLQILPLAELPDIFQKLFLRIIGLIILPSRIAADIEQHPVVHAVYDLVRHIPPIQQGVAGPQHGKAGLYGVFMEPGYQAFPILVLSIVQEGPLQNGDLPAISEIGQGKPQILVDLHGRIIEDLMLPDKVQAVKLIVLIVQKLPVIKGQQHRIQKLRQIPLKILRKLPDLFALILLIDHTEAADAKLRIRRCRRVVHGLQHLRIDIIIRVQGHEPDPLRSLDARISGSGHAAVFLMDHPDISVFLLICIKNTAGLVRRSVVHRNDLRIGPGLGQCGIQASSDGLLTVEGRDHNTDFFFLTHVANLKTYFKNKRVSRSTSP